MPQYDEIISQLKSKVSQFSDANKKQQPLNIISNLEPSNYSLYLNGVMDSFSNKVYLVLSYIMVGYVLYYIKPSFIMARNTNTKKESISYKRLILSNIVLFLFVFFIIFSINLRYNVNG